MGVRKLQAQEEVRKRQDRGVGSPSSSDAHQRDEGKIAKKSRSQGDAERNGFREISEGGGVERSKKRGRTIPYAEGEEGKIGKLRREGLHKTGELKA